MATMRIAVSSLALGLVLTAGAVAAPATARGVTQVDVCGTVTAYVPATLLLPGALAVDAAPFVIAPAVSLDASVAQGADICLELTLDGDGQVVAATVQPNVTTSLAVCGHVSAYVPATAADHGALAVASQGHVIAAGSSLPPIGIGSYLDLFLTLDRYARVIDASVLRAGASMAEACGSLVPPPARPAPTATPTPAPPTTGAPASTVAPQPVATAPPRPSPVAEPAQGGSARPPSASKPSRDAEAPGSGPRSAAPVGAPGGTAAAAPRATAIAAQPAAVEDPEPPEPDRTAIVPDSASLGRAGMAALQVSMPLFLLLAGLAGRELLNRRRPATAGSGTQATGGEPG